MNEAFEKRVWSIEGVAFNHAMAIALPEPHHGIADIDVDYVRHKLVHPGRAELDRDGVAQD